MASKFKALRKAEPDGKYSSAAVGRQLNSAEREETTFGEKSMGPNVKDLDANCPVLGTEQRSAAHVSRITPLDLKKRELANDRLVNPDEDNKMAAATKSARLNRQVRPLGGGAQ